MQSAPITVVHLDARQGNAFFEEKEDPQVTCSGLGVRV